MERLTRKRGGARVRMLETGDARALALELAGLRPTAPIDVMSLGLVLEPGEVALRHVPLELRHGRDGRWRGAARGEGLVTDRRVVFVVGEGPTVSLWWGSLAGFHSRLERGYVVLDYGDGFLRLLSGRAISTVAVAGVAALYGIRGLVEHPALATLRGPL